MSTPAHGPVAKTPRKAWRALLIPVGLAFTVLSVLALPSTTSAESKERDGRGSGRTSGAYLVKFRDDVVASAAVKFAAAGATEIGRLNDLNTSVIHIPFGRRDAVLRQLAADPRVESVEPDATAQATVLPRDPRWAREWGMRKIRAPLAWNVTVGSKKTVIAIIDTGVDPRQPDLRGRTLRGYDFHNGDSNAMDDNGHGTAVAGVAAAAGNDRVGIAGMCWRCLILPVKVLNSNGSGSHSNIAAGIVWAAKRGADVINLSLATPHKTAVIGNAIAYARRHGAVVIAAAGNEGSRSRFYPAAFPGVISVAASSGSDVLYHWSNRGPWIKLAAPGCAYTGKPRRAWSLWCGTSFATPAVAGTAALVKSLRPGISRSDLERMLLRSTVRVAGVDYGRIDAARAVRRAAAPGRRMSHAINQ